MTDYWVHDLDPYAIRLWGDFGVRWYGLAYLAAFLFAAWMFRVYEKRGQWKLNTDEQLSVLFAGVLGVILGGRIGYVLLYAFPEFLQNPLSIIAVWEGGMASHGGFVGVFVAALWVQKRYRIPLLRLGDLLVPIVPLGIMLGRIANFINGELWGRVTDVSWAVIFPYSAPAGTPLEEIPPRHPSQLYAAALEGLIPFVYLQWRFWYTKVGQRFPGQIAAEFLLLYSLGRIVGEQFREPDATLILGVSRGVFYSAFLLAAAIGLFVWARKKGLKNK